MHFSQCARLKHLPHARACATITKPQLLTLRCCYDNYHCATADHRRRTGAAGNNYHDAVKVGAVPVTGVLEFEKMER